MNKKKLLSLALSSSGALAVGRKTVLRTTDVLVLAYHRVLAAWGEDYDGDIELISASAEDFDWQVRFAARNADIMTQAELIDAWVNGRKLPKRPLVFTFDDGFADNVEVALPILKHHAAPATFFLSTDFIDSGERFWFDKLVAGVLASDASAVSTSRLATKEWPLPDGVSARRELAGQLLSLLKKVPDNDRLATLAEIHAGLGSQLQSARDALALPMNWDGAKALDDAGMDLGAHSRSHPVLSQLDDGAIAAEIGGARERIQAMTGAACTTMSYPVGGAEAFDERVRKAVADAGFELAYTYISGANPRRISDRFALQRIHVERYTSRAEFAAFLTLPRVFA